MERIKLMTGIVAMMALMVAVVMLGSSYAPPVEPYREIEEIWEIEDARTESPTPLLTALEYGGQRIGYDETSNTFYCPIGIPQDGEWPDISLNVPDDKGVRVCFVDDYSFDWCDEAVREGYSYQLLAYTDSAFSYCDIVFTGLPQVALDAHGVGLTHEDTAISFLMNTPSGAGMNTPARAHQRGDATLQSGSGKTSYKVEFTRTPGGTKKVYRQVDGLDTVRELVLLAMTVDETLMHDKLSWDLIAMSQSESDKAFRAPACRYVELFVNNRYMGVYLMFAPFDPESEIAAEGDLTAAQLYRTCVAAYNKDRPMYVDDATGVGYELFYAPQQEGAFEPLEQYLSMLHEADDAAFIAQAQKLVDMTSLMRYVALVQGMALADNVGNNMYIWVHGTPEGMKLRFVPWDMDYAWDSDPGPEADYWFLMPVADRLLRLDALGAREALVDSWRRLRETALSVENVQLLTGQYAHLLQESGAFARNAARWNAQMSLPDPSAMVLLTQWRLELLDERIGALSEGGELEFLNGEAYRQASHAVRMKMSD